MNRLSKLSGSMTEKIWPPMPKCTMLLNAAYVDSKMDLHGVERPGDHPHDPVSHGPGKPVPFRGEINPPCFASRSPLQGRRAPGLQLQEESRVGRWGKSRKEKRQSLKGERVHPPPEPFSSPPLWMFVQAPPPPQPPPPGYWDKHLHVAGGSAFFSVVHIVAVFTCWSWRSGGRSRPENAGLLPRRVPTGWVCVSCCVTHPGPLAPVAQRRHVSVIT